MNGVSGKPSGPLPLLRLSIITYDGLPPSSGGAHTLRTRSPLSALAQVRKFLSSCTDCEQPQQASVEVITGANVPAEFSAPLAAKLMAKLRSPGRSVSYGAGDTAHFWPIAGPQIDGFVAIMSQAMPIPVLSYRLQPITVDAMFRFHLLRPRSRAVLRWQGAGFYGNFSPVPGRLLGESQLYARISARSTVSLFLSFPFEEVAEDFFKTARFVGTHLPFSLSPHHWKRWRVAKSGKGYVGRRLAPRLLAAIR